MRACVVPKDNWNLLAFEEFSIDVISESMYEAFNFLKNAAIAKCFCVEVTMTFEITQMKPLQYDHFVLFKYVLNFLLTICGKK